MTMKLKKWNPAALAAQAALTARPFVRATVLGKRKPRVIQPKPKKSVPGRVLTKRS
jgi:hypothetical protein